MSGVAITADVAATDWRERLLEATTTRDLIAVVRDLAQQLPGARDAWVLWELDSGDLPPTIDADLLRLADEAIAAGAPHTNASGDLLALPLLTSTAVLVVNVVSDSSTADIIEALRLPLRVADRKLADRVRLAELEAAVRRLRRSEQVQSALFAISELSGSDHDMTEMLRSIHRIVGTLMYAENFYIVLRNLARDTVHIPYFADVVDPCPFDEAPLERIGHSRTWYVMHDAAPLRGNVTQLLKQISGPLLTVGTECYDWLGVPMLRDGVALGALVVQSYQPGIGFTAADQSLLEFVASHILTALERKRSTELLEHQVKLRTQQLAEANLGLQQEVAERQRAERLQAALFQIAQLATADIDEDRFFTSIHDIVGELLNAENFYIALLSDDRSALTFPYYINTQGHKTHEGRQLDSGLTEYVLRHRKPLLVDNQAIEALERSGEVNRSGQKSPPAECWLGAPLLSADQVLGVVALQTYDAQNLYGESDQELLAFVALQIGTSLHRRRSAQSLLQAYSQLEERVSERTTELRQQIREREHIQHQLQHEVMHDALTGLPNRGQLHDRIGQVLARLQAHPESRCALLYLDVDRFKVINDSLGHLAGDEFLRQIAQRLQSCVRDPDLVARVSGDEFAILIENDQVDAEGAPMVASAVAERVLQRLSAPLRVANRLLDPSVSIGVVVGHADYLHADDLIRDADIALYRAKSLGRKRWELFNDSLQRAAVDVLTLEIELRQALQSDQLEPWFQPIVRLADGAVVGHEALLRWQHPQRGVLRPGEFLQVAEDSGLIDAIDWRIFKRSFALKAQCASDGYLSINVSPPHLLSDNFAGRLLDLLERTGLAPEHLLIEVTEGSLLQEPERVRGVLEQLQEHGIGVALDDFGTGYSSLSYLHTFPLRVLKIDRTFLAALDRQHSGGAVIAAVLALARALGMDVVAEGIETETQRRALIELGCEFGQGYLFGYPAPRSPDACRLT
ncbi:MAG: EAL domain-containing protein [Lysobacter sp.]